MISRESAVPAADVERFVSVVIAPDHSAQRRRVQVGRKPAGYIAVQFREDPAAGSGDVRIFKGVQMRGEPPR